MNTSTYRQVLTAALLAIAAPLLALGDQPAELRFNPFERPAILDAPASAPEKKPNEPPALTGTLVSPDAPMAILDGELLKIGDEHAGYRLVAVREGAATLERQGEEIQILISNPVADGAKRRARR